MKEQATIYDFKRMCLNSVCRSCNFADDNGSCMRKNLKNILDDTDKTNDLVLKWCKEHQIKTRKTEFMKLFPNCKLRDDGYPLICINDLDKTLDINTDICQQGDCQKCSSSFWNEEIE